MNSLAESYDIKRRQRCSIDLVETCMKGAVEGTDTILLVSWVHTVLILKYKSDFLVSSKLPH